jgi:hypothetical protein
VSKSRATIARRTTTMTATRRMTARRMRRATAGSLLRYTDAQG